MTDHTAQIPDAVTRAYPGLEHHPVIVEVFHPDGAGWLTLRGRTHELDQLVAGSYRKRITGAFARSLRGQGVTGVALDVGGGRAADFTVAELLSRRVSR